MVLRKASLQFLGDRHRPMVPSRATNPDREIGLPLCLETGNHEGQKFVDAIDELFGTVGVEDVLANCLVRPP
jgi:hypothetical protein